MNTHDKYELPPLPPGHPTYEFPEGAYAPEQMQDYARAAIEADRKRRGEPVAWLYEDELPDNYPYEAMFPYSKVDGVRMFPVYAPQPAEPVKVPSDEEIIQMMVDRGWKHLDSEERTDIIDFARALLAGYGQPCPHCTPVDGKHGPAIQAAWHSGWEAARDATPAAPGGTSK